MTTDDSGSATPLPPLWDSRVNYQRVALRDLVVEMSVGVADWERAPGFRQRVVVNVELFSRKDSHASDDIASCINYDPIHEYIVNEWPNRPHTNLLETLAEELVGMCFQNPDVEACRVSLQKPDVYADTAAALVEFYRVRPNVALPG